MSAATDNSHKHEHELVALEQPHIVDIADSDRQDITATPSTINLHTEKGPDSPPSEASDDDSDKKKKKKEDADEPKVSYLQLYRFASTWDWTCVVYVAPLSPVTAAGF